MDIAIGIPAARDSLGHPTVHLRTVKSPLGSVDHEGVAARPPSRGRAEALTVLRQRRARNKGTAERKQDDPDHAAPFPCRPIATR